MPSELLSNSGRSPDSLEWNWRLLEWRLENFKSIRSATLSMGPLTILVGANSSGKSSVLQSILLAVQAMREAGGTSADGQFALNGDLVGLGRFEDVQTWPSVDHVRASRVQFGATLAAVGGGGGVTVRRAQLQRGRPQVTWTVDLEASDGDETVTQVVAFEAQASDPASRVRRDRDERLVSQLTEQLSLHREPGEVRALREVAMRGIGPMVPLRYSGSLTDGVEDSVQAIHAARFRAFLPQTLLHRGLLPELAADKWMARRSLGWQFTRPAPKDQVVPHELLQDIAMMAVEEWLGEGLPAATDRELMARTRRYGGIRGVIADSGSSLRELLVAGFKTEAENALDLTLDGVATLDRPSSVLEPALSDVMGWYAQRVHYLGPLRQDPQPTYSFGPPGVLGKKGEHAAAMLYRSGEANVVCPWIPGEVGRGIRRSLKEAVEDWGRYLGLFDHLEVTPAGRQGVNLSIFASPGSQGVDPMSVGVGVSQMLPVLIICLKAQDGDLILLEQPELHLHPKVQQRLADFLLGIAETGRQVVVETHSEYLVTRLRRRIAESESPKLLELIRILFAKWDEENGTTFRDVRPTEIGTLDDWPEDFFDESASDAEALLAAAARKLTGGS